MMFVIAPVPVAGITQALVVAAICGYGFLQFWLALQTSPDATIHRESLDPDELPVPERRRYFRRQLIASATVLPVAWAVIAYDYVGSWPAVAAGPIVGALAVAFWAAKLRKVDDRR